MLGSLTNPAREDWRDQYKEGEQVSTHYKGAWRPGVVVGTSGVDLLTVDVQDDGTGVGGFKGRATTKVAVRKSS